MIWVGGILGMTVFWACGFGYAGSWTLQMGSIPVVVVAAAMVTD